MYCYIEGTAIVVTGVDAGSVAAEAGLQENDTIKQISSIKTSSLSEKQCRRLLDEDRIRLLLRRAGAVKGAKKARKSAEKIAKLMVKREAKKQKKEKKKKSSSSSSSLGGRDLPAIPSGGGAGSNGDSVDHQTSAFAEIEDIRNGLLYGEIGADSDGGGGGGGDRASGGSGGVDSSVPPTPERRSNLGRSWSTKKRGRRTSASVAEVDETEQEGGEAELYATVDKSRRTSNGRNQIPPLPPRAASVPKFNLDEGNGVVSGSDATDLDGSLIYEMVGQAASATAGPVNQSIGFHQESARVPHQYSLGAAACYLLFYADVRAILMTSSQSKADGTRSTAAANTRSVRS